jgi:two-component system LytT family sensor kinase
MIIVGIGIAILLDNMKIAVPEHQHRIGFDYLISIAITILVWEGNLRIDTLMNRRFPWEKRPGKRILVHLPLSVTFSAFVIYLSMLAFNLYVCEFPNETKDRFMVASVIIGVLVTIIILSVEIGSQFFANWKKSLLEVEKYKTESLQAQLQNLKDQVNPHFMFNNLSVLSSLVYKDQDKAVDFINQLSKVYRYLLDSRNSELVYLRDELAFINSYTYLLQIRFDRNLVFNIDLPREKQDLMLPPMALQMLIENAIKHNEVSSDSPLTINVKMIREKIEVSNNLQLRSSPEDSCKTGLKNIKARYKFFTGEEVEIEETKSTYTVRIPLLKTTEAQRSR